MNFEVLNLSDGESGTHLNGRADGQLRGKFVGIRHSNVVTIAFGDLAEFPYHANLAERFCRVRNLDYRWQRKPDKLMVIHADAAILGGGHIELDLANKSVKFFGTSKAYGPIAMDELRGIVRAHPYFAGFRIAVRS